MKYHDQFQQQLENSKEVSILRVHNAPLILGFLQKAFREPGRLHIPLEDLVQPLATYIRQLKEFQPDLQYRKSAREYLYEWEQEGFIYILYLEEDDKPEVELTPSTEKVFQFLEDLADTSFVGTESRFLTLLERLKKVVYESMEDQAELLKELKKQRKELDERIKAIKSGEDLERMSGRRIREHYNLAKMEARHLLGDFREVEQNFRTIKKEIQRRHLVEQESRGQIVGFTLDAEEELNQSDQGASFEAFWDFARSPEKKDEFRLIVQRLYALEDIAGMEDDHYFISYVHKLMNAASKVLRSNRRMVEQLRRVLDEDTVAENRRVSALIEDIKRLALKREKTKGADRGFFKLHLKPDVNFPLERNLWKSEKAVSFDLVDHSEGNAIEAEEAVTMMTQQIPLDTMRLRKNIEEMFRRKSAVPLTELLERFPVESGLAELVAYLIIAHEEEKNEVNVEKREYVRIQLCDPKGIQTDEIKEIEIPSIIFKL